ncbi:hypothetical protein MSAN_01121400 [Mycena sanguinolenta]|uniref:Uncharacterized protein n=1 Tax=Mycena sanguinolenta TaxID=230812 RepID=A0A8H6YGV3_9AGAR|nr:hypothetical protein MSAN_01121400 [Mycena sanguinolenta]
MPSIFSRARTASTPSKSKHKPPPPPALSYPYPNVSSNAFGDPSTPIGEFGQQQAFSQRPRSLSQGQAQAAGEAGYGAVGFLPTTLPSDLNNAWASASSGPQSISLSSSTSSNASTTNLFAGTGGVAGGASASAGRAAYGLLSPRTRHGPRPPRRRTPRRRPLRRARAHRRQHAIRL